MTINTTEYCEETLKALFNITLSPQMFSIIIILLGGIVTYIVTIKIWEIQRRIEIRKEVYLDFFNVIVEGMYPSPVGYRKDPLWSRKIQLAKAKIDLFGSEEVKDIANNMMKIMYPNDNEKKESTDDERWNSFLDCFNNKFKPSIKEELETSKKWWKFWKKR